MSAEDESEHSRRTGEEERSRRIGVLRSGSAERRARVNIINRDDAIFIRESDEILQVSIHSGFPFSLHI